MGKWRCISHKSASSPPPPLLCWLRASMKESKAVSTECYGESEHAGRHSSTVLPKYMRLYRADTQERDSPSPWHLSVGYLYLTHTEMFLWLCFSQRVFSASFPSKLIRVCLKKEVTVESLCF